MTLEFNSTQLRTNLEYFYRLDLAKDELLRQSLSSHKHASYLLTQSVSWE